MKGFTDAQAVEMLRGDYHIGTRFGLDEIEELFSITDKLVRDAKDADEVRGELLKAIGKVEDATGDLESMIEELEEVSEDVSNEALVTAAIRRKIDRIISRAKKTRHNLEK